VKAALLREWGGPLETVEASADALRPDEVLVRTAATGICHSDIGCRNHAMPLELPMVLGHESAGTVEAVGAAVTYVSPGDKVVASPSSFCGTCVWCRRGQPALCTAPQWGRADGSARFTVDGEGINPFIGIGGFAEAMVVHENTVAKVPDAMPFAQASILGCGVSTGLGAAIRTAGVGFGDVVAVVGCGGVGLSAVQGARIAGARRIVAVDPAAAKRDLARELGATDVVDPGAGDAVAAVLELTGGVDHAIEAVGRPATIEAAFAMLGTAGTATIAGFAAPEDLISLPAQALIYGEKKIGGSLMGSTNFREDIPAYADLYLEGRLRLDQLVAKTIALDEVGPTLDAMEAGADEGARVVVTF
jgi:S-(hydroxymethyl)glutathione dehydrogenase / alcohol dehydrogenase